VRFLCCSYPGSCTLNGGPWWHNNCGYRASLNGRWGSGLSFQGMIWYTWKQKIGDVKSSMMMVRCD